MSIASTQLAMGYVGFTASPDNCAACSRSHRTAVNGHALRSPGQAALRCTEGGFFTMRKATCARFDNSAPGGRVQIGPTDI